MKNPLKKIGKAADAAKESKRQIIVTAITAVACLLCIGIGNFAEGIFVDSGKSTVDEMNRIQNEMDQFQKTDPAFTGITDIQTSENVRVEWEGRKLDTGRWSTDKSLFWEWISPAFNYNSATEYNQTRESFISEKGLGKCLFTTQFMAPYDIEEQARKKYGLDADGKPSAVNIEKVDTAYKCTASPDASGYYIWPIAEENDGSYRYVARIRYGFPGAGATELNTCVFMFTARHTTGENGADRVTIYDFECWP